MTGKRHNPHFRKLLVGYDGSKESEKAVDVALSLAECVDASCFGVCGCPAAGAIHVRRIGGRAR